MKIVRLENNIVKEILPEATYEKGITYWYGEAFAARCVEAPDDVKQGMAYNPSDGTFSEPVAEEPIITKTLEEEVEELKQVVADLASLQLEVLMNG